MGFVHLLRTDAAIAAFRAGFNIPPSIKNEFYPEKNIENDRLPKVVFFPLMVILKGGVRFLVVPILLRTLSFYELSPGQCLPNFYKVVSNVICLKTLYGLGLNHHDINFMNSICGGLETSYYLKIRNPTVMLILSLPDSNRNSIREFIKVSRNWLTGELTCPTSPRQIGRNLYFPSTRSIGLITFVLPLPISFLHVSYYHFCPFIVPLHLLFFT